MKPGKQHRYGYGAAYGHKVKVGKPYKHKNKVKVSKYVYVYKYIRSIDALEINICSMLLVVEVTYAVID